MLQPVSPPPAHVIVNPDWSQRPDGPALSAAYPEAALRLALSGRAVIQCRVTEAGLLSDCALRQEAPAGLGFAQAALSLSHTFKMKPRSRDGRPTGDGVVTIPLNFVAPGSRTPNFAQPAALVQEAPAGQPMPTSLTAPCPDASGKLCVTRPFEWAASPALDPGRPLYGAVQVQCRVAPGGALSGCRGAAMTRGADLDAAIASTSGLKAPEGVAGVATAGALVRFVVIPPPAPTLATPGEGRWAEYDRRHANLIALIAHGTDADLEPLAQMAAAGGFPAKHVEGPEGDELIVPFPGGVQPAARAFVREARSGRFANVHFEEATLPAGSGDPTAR